MLDDYAVPVIPGKTKEAIRLEQSVTLFKRQVCVYQVYPMHDGHQICHSALLSNLLVDIGGADGVDGDATFKSLSVCCCQQLCITFNGCYPKPPVAPLAAEWWCRQSCCRKMPWLVVCLAFWLAQWPLGLSRLPHHTQQVGIPAERGCLSGSTWLWERKTCQSHRTCNEGQWSKEST